MAPKDASAKRCSSPAPRETRQGASGETDKKTDEPSGQQKPVSQELRKEPFLSKKKKIGIGLVAGCVLLALIFKPKGFGKKEAMMMARDTLIQMQSLRDYGLLGLAAFVMIFVASLIGCLPVTTLLDVALGQIYGAVLGTTASLLSKLLGALAAVFIGRRFGKMIGGLELPAALKDKLTTVRTQPFACLLAARLTPCSTGIKNYAFSLLPAEDLPIPQYSAAIVCANVFFTVSICTAAANADNLMTALDNAMGGH